MSLASSRTAKLSSTPASLRKELRNLSRELSSSDGPPVSSSKTAKAPAKLPNKENFRPAAHSVSESEWMRGGGLHTPAPALPLPLQHRGGGRRAPAHKGEAQVSPAVFSFSGSPTPPHFNAASDGLPFSANSSAGCAVSGKVQLPSTGYGSVWEPGSAIPRGLMVSAQLTPCGETHAYFYRSASAPTSLQTLFHGLRAFCAFGGFWLLRFQGIRLVFFKFHLCCTDHILPQRTPAIPF